MKSRRSISALKLVIRITCTPSGQDRNFTGKEIPERFFTIFCRRICSRYMTQPEGRAMKCGIFEQTAPGDFGGQNYKVQILSLKKICREGIRIESNYGTQIYRIENRMERQWFGMDWFCKRITFRKDGLFQ
jgi:hypothetical protein